MKPPMRYANSYQLSRAFLVGSLALLIAACAARAPAPIYDRDGKATRSNPARSHTTRVRPATYTVRKGDTLYGIAWRYSLDYRQIASWNGLSQPFTIYPQQKLRLTQPSQTSVQVTPAGPVATTPAPQRTTPKPSGPTPQPPRVTPKPQPERPATEVVTRQPIEPAPPAPKPSPKPRPDDRPSEARGDVRWLWPTSGGVLTTFAASDPGRKGIDIAGSYGQPVKAAAAGQVVYSGSGLIGYGELIIIKHNQRFLSAYGHNRKRLVAEGDQVVAGQKIAEMGSSGADRSLLHFEIRRDGEPVNPQAFLPKR